jgi:hypothetical protein
VASFQCAEGQVAEQLAQTEAQLQAALREQQEWEALATAAEADKAALAERLAALQQQAQAQGARSLATLRQKARQAAARLDLDEAATRLLIDEQLRQAGWEADSQRLRYSQGARPEKHRNLAISEWPTAGGPADYMLFVGLTPLAAVEAKRAHKEVAGVLPQAERYCRDAAGEVLVPFAFASNGRPFLQQLRSASGIWFRDLRRPTNLPVPLEGWYSPEGLRQLARQDLDSAEEKLRREAFNFGFPLRPYQRRAIEAVEAAIAAQQREILLACATGTGKTKTAVALVYRALKTGRFRRVLFRVDREEQGERVLESDTRVHIAADETLGADPHGSARAEAGAGSAGLQRNHPGHGLAGNHQPGDGRLDPGFAQLEQTAARLAAAHRQPNEGDHDRGSRSAGRRPAVLQPGRRRLAAAEPAVRRRDRWRAAAVPARGVGGVRWPYAPESWLKLSFPPFRGDDHRSACCRSSRVRSVWHRPDAAVAAAGSAADARAVRAGVRGQP